MKLFLYLYFFFFFQAEDGIRDIGVTGVQTCALPIFRRQPPQLNYPPGTVPDPDHGSKLDIQSDQSGISTMTPPELASGLHSLPPILHKPHRTPIPSCSKGHGVFPSCCA